MGDSSKGVTRQAGGIVVASEAGVDVVVVGEDQAVGVVGSSVSAPLAVVEAMTKAESLGRPVVHCCTMSHQRNPNNDERDNIVGQLGDL